MTTQPQPSSILRVDLKVNQNNLAHHTGKISKDLLVVRRGQSLTVSVQFKHPFIKEVHKLTFTAETGEKPEENRGTKSVFGIPDSVKRSAKAKAVWRAAIDHTHSYPEMGTVTLIITPPADAPIGKYTVHMNHSGEETKLGSLVVLFNPWCTDDWVYMSDEAGRQEYVMNEHGVIFFGSGNYISSRNWDYGQFEENMVQICLMILDLNLKHLKDPADDVSARCNPIYVSRVISAMINSNDDRGVLEGRWSGNYSGGVSPSSWSGSHAILQRWLTTNCKPVKYGQCWVFAGVMCSVMRFLGIPCRVVTNFESAHDSNGNLIIDVYHPDYGVRGIPSEDSVWNFHVWVEGWMRRPDLPDGHDGWQVVDPTPQEKSHGVYCCGPAPVKAVFEGKVDLKYDIPFVFAEVNADCIDWLVKADGSKTKIYSDTKRVGQNISTKSVGSDKRWNITDNYKHKEGSPEERAVFEYAVTRDYTSGGTEDSEDSEHETNDNTAEETEPRDSGRTDNPPTEGGTSVNEPAITQPAVNKPAITQPAITQPAVNEPSVTQPAVTQPAVIQPAITQPAVTQPAQPAVTQPAVTQPAVTQPEVTQPAITQPEVTQPAITQPAITQPAITQPAITQPAVTQPAINGTGENSRNEETRHNSATFPQVTLRFEEVCKPVNGKDVKVNLVIHNKATESRSLSINISVQAMSYNGSPLDTIQTALEEATLLPGKDLCVPVVVPFSEYWKPMLDSDVMKISAVVSDTQNSSQVFLAKSDVVLVDPPINIKVLNEARVWRTVILEVSFMNPVSETLKDCTMTLSGSGLWRENQIISLPELRPSNRFRVNVSFVPYKTGLQTLVANFDCSMFRDIKGSTSIPVKENIYRY